MITTGTIADIKKNADGVVVYGVTLPSGMILPGVRQLSLAGTGEAIWSWNPYDLGDSVFILRSGDGGAYILAGIADNADQRMVALEDKYTADQDAMYDQVAYDEYLIQNTDEYLLLSEKNGVVLGSTTTRIDFAQGGKLRVSREGEVRDHVLDGQQTIDALTAALTAAQERLSVLSTALTETNEALLFITTSLHSLLGALGTATPALAAPSLALQELIAQRNTQLLSAKASVVERDARQDSLTGAGDALAQCINTGITTPQRGDSDAT